jgi:hypothetical protein
MFSSPTAAAGKMTRSRTKDTLCVSLNSCSTSGGWKVPLGRNALVESWSEHMRQHGRLTEADRAAEDEVRAFHLGEGAPVVSRFVAECLPKSHEGRSH